MDAGGLSPPEVALFFYFFSIPGHRGSRWEAGPQGMTWACRWGVWAPRSPWLWACLGLPSGPCFWLEDSRPRLSWYLGPAGGGRAPGWSPGLAAEPWGP